MAENFSATKINYLCLLITPCLNAGHTGKRVKLTSKKRAMMVRVAQAMVSAGKTGPVYAITVALDHAARISIAPRDPMLSHVLVGVDVMKRLNICATVDLNLAAARAK